MNLKIYPATPTDIPVLVQLMAEFYAESSLPLDSKWAERSFHILLGDQHLGAVWIASLNGKTVGHIVLCLRHSMEVGGFGGYIDDLYVRPSARRQGVGRALLDTLISHSRSIGVLALHVEVASDNEPAQALYHYLGLRARSDLRLLTARLQ